MGMADSDSMGRSAVASGVPRAVALQAGEVTAAEVLEQLARIISSSALNGTERSRRMLDYLVKEVLAGRQVRIKAYSIATEVLGRAESFDPQKDPIVRIEAARLRRGLEHYYLTDGRDDPIVIDVPKGGYVPQFTRRPEAGAALTAIPAEPEDLQASRWLVPAPWVVHIAAGILAVVAVLAWQAWFGAAEKPATIAAVQRPGLIVKPLADLSRDGNSTLMAEGLTGRIIEKTSRFRELAVIAGGSGADKVSSAEARYELGGSLRTREEGVIVQTRLVDRVDGRVIWAESFDVDLKPHRFFQVEQDIADQIAVQIAAPTGLVFDAERRSSLDELPESWTAYSCTLNAYGYRATFAANKFDQVRSCLEKAVRDYPGYATAWALLSLTYIDEYRFFFPPPPGSDAPPLARAYESARRAVEIDPDHIRAQQALMMALFFRQDHEAAIDVGKKALALNSNDTEFKGEFGYRLAFSGNWDEGCDLLQQALEGSARKTSYYKVGLALCLYMKNDMKGAATLITEADAVANPNYHLIAAAILSESGNQSRAEEHRAWLEGNAASQLPRLLDDIPNRILREEDRLKFLKSLRKAGFAVES